jgi:SAM-dependent methyltransferase
MEYSFPRYLAAKKTIDDRALNGFVWQQFMQELGQLPAGRLLEVGAGVGTMLQRLLEREALPGGEYWGIDQLEENIAAARQRLPEVGERFGWTCEIKSEGFALRRGEQALKVGFASRDVWNLVQDAQQSQRWDGLVAHAFLDLFDIPALLPGLRQLVVPGGLAYFSLNFDGVTILEPEIDAQFDACVLAAYHHSMDKRMIEGRLSGDSRAGRHLFQSLPQAGFEILAAGSSDWVVYPRAGSYADDDAYFLNFILHFFEESLSGHPDLDPARFRGWLAQRREQIERGELVLIAHQLDFLLRVPKQGKIKVRKGMED